MSDLYGGNYFPATIEILCPNCRGCGQFFPVELVHIHSKKEITYFQESPHFTYFVYYAANGLNHAAKFYTKLILNHAENIPDLPPGYAPNAWKRLPIFPGCQNIEGTAFCSHCHYRSKHQLSWSKEAYYQIEDHGHLLWAYNREAAIALRDFILSSERNYSQHPYSNMLRYVPKRFLLSKHRNSIVKKLNQLLRYT